MSSTPWLLVKSEHLMVHSSISQENTRCIHLSQSEAAFGETAAAK